MGLEAALDETYWDALQDIPKIPELDIEPAIATVDYEIVPIEEILDDYIAQNDVIIVSGSFFGDEAKGKLTALLAHHENIEIVARVNSGENAGHTVWKKVKGKWKKYVFHLAPSSILDKKSVIGSECVMDPINFMQKEYMPVIEDGFAPDLTVGNCQIVTPYHKLMDLIRNINSPNTSTLKGMSAVHSSKVMKKGLRLDHLFSLTRYEQRKRLKADMKQYFGMLQTESISEEELLKKCEEQNRKSKNKVPDHVMQFLRLKSIDKKVDYLLDLYQETVVDNENFPKMADTKKIIQDALAQGKKIGIEGSQSNPLGNKCEHHWSSSTSADTSASGLASSAGINVSKYKIAVLNVNKFPPSRVGAGANPAGHVPQNFFAHADIEKMSNLDGICEDFDEIHRQYFRAVQDNGILKPTIYTDKDGKQYPIQVAMAIAEARLHGEEGATTGKPRITCLYDCLMQREVMNDQGPNLSMACLDRGNHYEKVGLVIGYIVCSPNGPVTSKGVTYNTGDVIKPGDQLPNENVLRYCRPIIKVMDGWKDTPLTEENVEPNMKLPKAVTNFLAAIEHYSGAEIDSFGYSPKTKHIIGARRKVKFQKTDYALLDSPGLR